MTAFSTLRHGFAAQARAAHAAALDAYAVHEHGDAGDGWGGSPDARHAARAGQREGHAAAAAAKGGSVR
jgi:hypothetical protein